MLRNALQPMYPADLSEAALGALGLRPDARAQDLTVEQFAALHGELQARLLQMAAGDGDSGALAS